MSNAKPGTRIMEPAAYDDMKAKLRTLLQKWGIWTSAEIGEVAEFIELQILQDRSAREVPLVPKLSALKLMELSEHPPENWLQALAVRHTDMRLIESFKRAPNVSLHYLGLLEMAFKK